MNGCGAPRDGALGVVTFLLTAEASLRRTVWDFYSQAPPATR
jgi:hypothetical protein